MKATVKIPKDWRRVRRGKARDGDLCTLWYDLSCETDPGWHSIQQGIVINWNDFIIRRKRRRT